jgi:hypothetical protein
MNDNGEVQAEMISFKITGEFWLNILN